MSHRLDEQYVVIRRRQPPLSVFTESSLTVDPLPATLTAEIVDGREIDRMLRGGDVAAFAPEIPTRSIPLEPATAPRAQISWGIKAVRADTSTYTGAGVTVALLDTGVNAAHPAFDGVTITHANFTEEPDASDMNGHGTYCAGILVGRDVENTRIGVARGITNVLSAKVIGNGGTAGSVVRAILWAGQLRAQVISMSLTLDFPAYQRQLMVQHGLPQEAATSAALRGYRLALRLFDRLAELTGDPLVFGHPSLLVAATGNESARHATRPYTIEAGPPAISDGFVGVGSLGQTAGGQLGIAATSNTGATVAAPGVAIISAARSGGLTTSSDTSAAAPHVAGVAALWAQKLRESNIADPRQLRVRVLGMADTAALSPSLTASDVGFGLVQAPQ